MPLFSERLKDLRNEKELTQRELARLLELSSSTIAMYETGQRMPDPETLQKLADFFNVTVDYLLGRTGIRNYEEHTTIAAHRTTGLDDDLPPEAQKAIEEFRQYIREKYGK